jgi:lipopolysaccharide export system permease protein
MTGQKGRSSAETLTRTKFDKTQVVFDLSSFQLERTDKKWFQGNRIMRNLSELDGDIDSMRNEILSQKLNYYSYKQSYFSYYGKKDSLIYPMEVYRYQRYRDSINNLPPPSAPANSPIPSEAQAAVSQNQKPAPPMPSGSTPATTQPAAQNPPPAQTPVIKPRKEPVKKRPTELTAKRKKAAIKPPIKKKPVVPVKPALAKVEKPAQPAKRINKDSLRLARIDSVFAVGQNRDILQGAANMARQVKSQVLNANTSIDNYGKELATFEIQWHKILASSLACIAMFLIGAPLGAIIKRGGLGVPFLISILFFIIYYVLTMQGEKLAKQGTVSAAFGVWMADAILLVAGLFFLRQARRDARLFEADFYSVVFDKVKRWFAQRKSAKMVEVRQ